MNVMFGFALVRYSGVWKGHSDTELEVTNQILIMSHSYGLEVRPKSWSQRLGNSVGCSLMCFYC